MERSGRGRHNGGLRTGQGLRCTWPLSLSPPDSGCSTSAHHHILIQQRVSSPDLSWQLRPRRALTWTRCTEWRGCDTGLLASALPWTGSVASRRSPSLFPSVVPPPCTPSALMLALLRAEMHGYQQSKMKNCRWDVVMMVRKLTKMWGRNGDKYGYRH